MLELNFLPTYTQYEDKGLFLYKIKLIHEGKKLDSIYINDEPQQLEPINWNLIRPEYELNYVMKNYSDIIVGKYNGNYN